MMKRVFAVLAVSLAVLPSTVALADVGPKCKCQAPGASVKSNAVVVGSVFALGAAAVFIARKRGRKSDDDR